MAKQRTVVFDFDGTLADTLTVALRACNAVAAELGLAPVHEHELAALRRMSAREALRHQGVPLAKLPLLVRRVRQEMRQNIVSVRLFSGMPGCLQKLHGYGVRLGVVTTNSRQNVQACLDRNQVLPLFEFVHTSTHLFGKHRALRRLVRARNLLAGSVFYVGDQTHDVEAARRARVTPIAACWGYQSRERLESVQPEFLANRPEDIARFVLA